MKNALICLVCTIIQSLSKQIQIGFPTYSSRYSFNYHFLKMSVEVINFYWILWPKEVLFQIQMLEIITRDLG